MTAKFSIGGMSCSACSSGIEKSVNRLDGVVSAQVSLMQKSMTVDFDHTKISAENIIVAVEKLGYTARPFGEDEIVKNPVKKRFFWSLGFLIPLMYLSMGGMIGLPTLAMKISLPIQAVLAIIILIINKRFFISGVRAVKNLSPNMDTLVSLGSFSAYVYSLVEMILLFTGKTVNHVFFEASAMVLVLVTLGKWLEDISKRKTGQEIEKLSKLIPKAVTVIRDGKQTTILTSQLVIGDLVVVKAGDYLAVDGVILEGNGALDKSAITGESIPEEVTVGGAVTSGSIVKNGYLVITAKKVGEQTLFSKIINAVKTAGASKAPVQKLADKISAWFVPTVTAIALVTFIIWLIIKIDLYYAFNYAISVLVVSCPCALGLATPVAVMAATGKGASMGILFKDAEALQKAKNVNCVILDKTATLTVGKPKVTEFENLSNLKDQEVLSIAYALEQKSNHPLADAVLEFCKNSDKKVDNFTYEIGKGIRGEIDGQAYYLGNYNLTNKIKERYVGKSIVALSIKDKIIALFLIADYLKENSKDAVNSLNNLGIKTVMLTGDNQSSAKLIADQTGILEFKSEVLPTDKLSGVNEYKEKGYFVAMVGDGINDSPALKGADVGIAMGNGTDVAIDSADIILAGGNLYGVSNAVGISKKATGIIKENLFWAFIYNVLMIPIAGGALSFVGITLSPMLASAAMCVSSLFVVTNALRINGYKKIEEKDSSKENIMKVKIEGMMCKHCEAKVKEIISLTKDVQGVEIKLKKGLALIDGNPDKDALKTAIESAGYKVISIE